MLFEDILQIESRVPSSFPFLCNESKNTARNLWLRYMNFKEVETAAGLQAYIYTFGNTSHENYNRVISE